MKHKHRILSMPAPVTALLGYSLSVLIVILSLKYLTLVAAPIFFAFVIAYLLSPVVDFMEKKWSIRRSISAALLLLMIVCVFSLLLTILLPYLVDEVKLAANKFPEFISQFNEKLKVVSNYIKNSFSGYGGRFDLVKKIESMIANVLNHLSGLLMDVFSNIYSIFVTVLYIVFIPLIAYYFLKDAREIQRSFFGLIPPRHIDHVIRKVEKMNVIFSAFIRGQSIVVLILITLYCIGLSLIKLPFALLIGVMSGIGDFIPYMGTVVGFIVSIIIGIAHFDSPKSLLLIVLVFSLVKGSENWFYYPKIVGKKVGLHFLWILLAIVAFGHIFGFWGLLVAIPSAAGLKMHILDVVKYYKHSHFFRKE
ncbi:MAG: AI-2E family transporter [Candidatus Omnitrophota bacterium]